MDVLSNIDLTIDMAKSTLYLVDVQLAKSALLRILAGWRKRLIAAASCIDSAIVAGLADFMEPESAFRSHRRFVFAGCRALFPHVLDGTDVQSRSVPKMKASPGCRMIKRSSAVVALPHARAVARVTCAPTPPDPALLVVD